MNGSMPSMRQSVLSRDARDEDSKPVRVCFVIDRLARAGTESQLLLLLDQLDRKRIEPYLCLLNGYDDTSKELLPDNCITLRLGIRSLKSLHALRQAWRFWRFLKGNHIDILQTYFTDSMLFASPIAKAAGVCAVFGSRRNVGHSITKRSARIARVYNRLFLDRIIANCEAARQAVIAQEGAKPEQVIVLPNGIDLERFKDIQSWQPKSPTEPRKVGMVGNLREVKGPDLFINAAQLVLEKHPCTQFVIAGDGDSISFQTLIDGLGLTDNVRLLGPVTDIPAFLGTLDVAVLPSRAEGLSNALLEYMAAGRPTVATDVGGNSELLRHEVNGLLVQPHDGVVLADAITRLLEDTVAADRYSTTAKRDAQHYSAANMLLQLEHTYEKQVEVSCKPLVGNRQPRI